MVAFITKYNKKMPAVCNKCGQYLTIDPAFLGHRCVCGDSPLVRRSADICKSCEKPDCFTCKVEA
jgi:hypothetical protein